MTNLFRLPSTWMPPKGRDASLETYIKTVRNDVSHHIELLQNKIPRDNLSSAERKALKHLLLDWKDIVINPANKASMVVALSEEDYIE